jgi:hypothetical protein
MNRARPGHVIIIGTFCILGLGADFVSAQGAYLDKIYTTPDYTQTDSSYGGFPDNNGVMHGGVFCGPCSASNSLMWLANNGWENLCPPTGNRKRDQHDLIEVIASDQYMDSYEHNGTNPTRIANGMYDYIRDCGYDFNRFEWQGRRYVPSQFDTGVNIPDLDWMREGIEGPTTVQLWSVGWYGYDAETDNYSRDGGHWVTMVGYGQNGSGEDCMIIHDPSPRTGYSLQNNYVKLTPLQSGTKDHSEDLTGQYWLTGWPINSVGDRAILDGVFVIDLAPANCVPVAENDAYGGYEDTGLSVSLSQGLLENDTDGDNDSLSAILVSPPSHGEIDLTSNGVFDYFPNADYHGVDSFTYLVSDGKDYSSPATVYLDVASVNDVPAADDRFYTGEQDKRLNVYTHDGLLRKDESNDPDNVDSDPNNDVTLQIVLQSDPENGSLYYGQSGWFQYTPQPGFHGIDSFTYQLFDGEAWSNLATVTIDVVAPAVPEPGVTVLLAVALGWILSGTQRRRR